MIWQLIPAKQDAEDDFCVTLGLGGTTIGLWHVTPTWWSYKKWQNYHPLQPLGHIQSRQTKDRDRQDEGSLPDPSPCGGLCRTRGGSWAKPFRGTRDGLIWEEALGVWMCVCVCVRFVVSICGPTSRSVSLWLNTAPLTDSRPAPFGLCITSTVC